MTQDLQQIVAQWRYVPDSAALRVCAVCNIKADAGLCGSCAQAWAAKLPILAQQLLDARAFVSSKLDAGDYLDPNDCKKLLKMLEGQ